MTHLVPIRIGAHRLHSEESTPAAGLFQVSHREAEQIIQGIVMAMARQICAEGVPPSRGSDAAVIEESARILDAIQHSIEEAS